MVNWENYEEYMMLYADNELNEADEVELFAFINEHPELKKELEAYAATKLIPDTKLVFADKDALLKKGGGTINLGKWYMYAAAAAVLLFAVLIVQQNDTKHEVTPIAKTEPAAQPEHKEKPMDTTKELHSPADPVATENNLASHQPAKAAKKKPNTINVQPAPKQEHYITKEVPKQKELPKPVVAEPKEEVKVAVTQPVIEKAPVTEKIEQPAVTNNEEPKENKRSNFLAKLLRKDKAEGAQVLAEAVNDRVQKIKNIKDNLKDTDISFRIGQTELFVVKL